MSNQAIATVAIESDLDCYTSFTPAQKAWATRRASPDYVAPAPKTPALSPTEAARQAWATRRASPDYVPPAPKAPALSPKDAARQAWATRRSAALVAQASALASI